jgi:hypothetical protein
LTTFGFSLAPASRSSIKISLNQNFTLSVSAAKLVEQLKQLAFSQRRQLSASKSSLETSAFHPTAVVIEDHFECRGPRTRCLPRRLPLRSEWFTGNNPRSNRQAETVPEDQKHEGGKSDKDGH